MIEKIKMINKFLLFSIIIIICLILVGFFSKNLVFQGNKSKLKEQQCDALSDGIKKIDDHVVGVIYDKKQKECVIYYQTKEAVDGEYPKTKTVIETSLLSQFLK